ncbi:archaellin/type IV pilin N-terminal domain-containing protein [Natronorubrum halophilum]|uniref:archaellin/type IV pilin N-terminal domain-containing protein n=1 Tax=Natronorubrum halophilum TaxID=1702106 RepID=UPI0010C20597|nr:archaellin/type IV pilin N-terminal domain-containing protein [Natronorubrum halophilum]
MFETITDDDERGQVGIGTLIVFIAMVLVAAIAAGVLINTAGSLQSQASDTGSETQQAVANQIEVIHAYGDVDGNSSISDVNLVVKKSAGSDVIDLDSMTVQFTSETTSETLELGDGALTSSGLAGTDSDTALVNTDDRIELQIDLTAVDGGSSMETGDSATVEIVDQSGATFTYGVTVPQTFSDDANVVEV